MTAPLRSRPRLFTRSIPDSVEHVLARGACLPPQRVAVVSADQGRQGAAHAGDIFKRTGLGSGRVYPALARLESAGLAASGWSLKGYQDTFPPLGRRYYWPTVRASKRFEQWQEVSR